MLKLALEKGHIEHLGDRMSDVVEYCHFLRHREGTIPTLIIRFFSRSHLFAFMTLKKESLDAINGRISKCRPEQNISGYPLYPNRPIKCQHSLSRLNKALETFLWSTKMIKRTKLSGQTMCAMLKNETVWSRIENPYSHTFEGLFRPMDMTDVKAFMETTPLEMFVNTTPKEREMFFSMKCRQFLVRESDSVPSNTGEVNVEKETVPPQPSTQQTSPSSEIAPMPTRRNQREPAPEARQTETEPAKVAEAAERPEAEPTPAVAEATSSAKGASNSGTALDAAAAAEITAANKRPSPGRPPKVPKPK